jgi:hypothetical protein
MEQHILHISNKSLQGGNSEKVNKIKKYKGKQIERKSNGDKLFYNDKIAQIFSYCRKMTRFSNFFHLKLQN